MPARMGKPRFCWIFLAFLGVSCTTQHGLRPIRPDVPWNRNAKQFIWPPVLRLDNIAKDGGSVFVYASAGSRHELNLRDDVVSLGPIRGKLPIGATKARNRTC